MIPGTKTERRAEERGMGEEGGAGHGEGLERQTDGSGLEEDRQTDRREAQGERRAGYRIRPHEKAASLKGV